ncbi:MAG: 3-oxoacyl-ACP synthase III family protein [Bacteroidota bacterium]|nr:3-oxoacyl-ACP synthase III family protein [Bacteroidota bacterium]MDX5428919.1 3-oxoacyl-ACP synthase III family protein [Bacteroidota bacterium]MDX5506595.1 3-oxoacyl-ACP synthase III family protein [Bacteroidota bacterium]
MTTSKPNSYISGTGSYIPEREIPNSDFESHEFYSPEGERIQNPGSVITEKFESITGIRSRRYVDDHLVNSDIGTIAAQRALEDAGVDKESIDQIIVAQNFGDIPKGIYQYDMVPSLAARVKQKLGIENPECIAYDVIYGCPGWIQGLIQADQAIRAGVANKCLVIGCDTLSRVLDPHDRDSMIFADGAGACVLERSNDESGILAYSSVTHSLEEASFIGTGPSNKPGYMPGIHFIKMKGRKVYEYAMTYVPQAMKGCLEKAGIGIDELKKVFIHQANEKMDEGIIQRLFRLYGFKKAPKDIMPMNIHELGNSSVATIPTLLDMVRKGEYEQHSVHKGDLILLASVGAGMNINAIVYRW